jgi:hypothetical protein
MSSVATPNRRNVEDDGRGCASGRCHVLWLSVLGDQCP